MQYFLEVMLLQRHFLLHLLLLFLNNLQHIRFNIIHLTYRRLEHEHLHMNMEDQHLNMHPYDILLHHYNRHNKHFYMLLHLIRTLGL